jgi:hypothetical protein
LPTDAPGPVLPRTQPECVGDGGDSGLVGERETEDHLVCAGLNMACDQVRNLMRLADGESGDLLGESGRR